MWTQRDQIQAYQFLRRRVVSALVKADANHPVSPSRRLVLGTALSLAAAVLVCAGFGIVGFLKPAASDDWKKGGQVIVEKETGTRFVIGKDGQLHPMLNYTSARLLAGGDGTATTTVTAKRLSTVPRGAPLGIAGAPDSLPLPNRLLTGPWTACTQRDADLPANSPASTAALFGVNAQGTAVPGQAAVIVAVPGGDRYAVTSGHRYRIASARALEVLGWDAVTPLPAAGGWLTTLPAGRDLDVIDVPGAGRPGVSLDKRSTQVGQILQADNVGAVRRYYLVLAKGLAPITQTEANLVLGAPSDKVAHPNGSPRPIQVDAADVTDVPQAANVVEDEDVTAGGYPPVVPQAASIPSGTALCAPLTGAKAGLVSLFSRIPVPSGLDPVTTENASDERVAAQVVVPPATGALVTTRVNPSGPAGTTFLLTDTGVKYPVAGTDALAALGYGQVTPTPLNPATLALFPTGPTLATAAAGQPAAATAGR